MGVEDDALRNDHRALPDEAISAERAAVGAIDVEAKVTVYVVFACAIAASGGVLFGKHPADCDVDDHACDLPACLPCPSEWLHI